MQPFRFHFPAIPPFRHLLCPGIKNIIASVSVFCQWSLYTYLFRPKQFVFTRLTPPGSGYSDRITTLPVPVYRRGRGGMSRRASDSRYCAVKKARSDLQNAVPAALRFFIFAQQFFWYQPPAFFHGWARKACLQSSYCVPCAGRIFVRKTIQVSAKHLLFWASRRTFLCGGVTLF